jgi:hypothetical protein
LSAATFPNPFISQKVIKLGDKIYVNLNLKPEITFGVTRILLTVGVRFEGAAARFDFSY